MDHDQERVFLLAQADIVNLDVARIDEPLSAPGSRLDAGAAGSGVCAPAGVPMARPCTSAVATTIARPVFMIGVKAKPQFALIM